MRAVLLGSGNTHGIPVPGCTCVACISAGNGSGPRRRPSCGLIRADSTTLPIDAGLPGLAQALPGLRDVLLTHFHPDHVLGLVAGRHEFTGPVQVHAPDDPGRVAELADDPGRIRLNAVPPYKRFPLGPIAVIGVPLRHPVPTLGWLLEFGRRRLAWLTDTYDLDEDVVAFIRSWAPDTAVIDCSFAPEDPRAKAKQHNDLPMALSCLTRIQAKRGVLIHLDHSLQAHLINRRPRLPAEVIVGEDGMEL